MRVWRDVAATVFVAIGVLVAALVASGADVAVATEASHAAIVLLVLGIAASASAVVPGWGDLMAGSRVYFAAASAIGVVALAGGAWAYLANEALGLVVMVVATVALWAMSTARHLGILRTGGRLRHA